MEIIIIIFTCTIIMLLGYIYLTKSQIRNISSQLKKNKIEKMLNIALFNEDIIQLASIINENILYQKEQKLNIKKREQQLKEAVFTISHDLRTPLTSIIGYLQLLEKSNLDNHQRDSVEIVLTRSEDLRKLIYDFYELSILETHESLPNLEKLNLEKIITECILNYSEQFEKINMIPKLEISKETQCVYADELMLKRIICNLLTNALRYGKGELIITAALHEGINLSFQNNISEREMFDPNRLFEKFYTGDAARNKSGTGLGLYITKVLTEKMGGTIIAKVENNTLKIMISLVS